MVCFAVAPRKWTASGRETVPCAVKVNMRLWGRHDCSKVGGRDWNRQHVVGSLRQTHFQLNDNMWCVTEPELLQDSLFRTMEESMLYRDEINWVERRRERGALFFCCFFFCVCLFTSHHWKCNYSNIGIVWLHSQTTWRESGGESWTINAIKYVERFRDGVTAGGHVVYEACQCLSYGRCSE